MVLRKVNVTNIHSLQKVCIDAYSLNFHHHWNPGGLTWYQEREFGYDRLIRDLNDSDIEYFFIHQNENPIGFIKIRSVTMTEYALDHVVELEKIYIIPDKKGAGFGKKALTELIDILKEKGKEYLFLGVIDTNLPAIAFYKKIGFKFHSKTLLDIPFFREELKGMHKMMLQLSTYSP